MLLSGADDDEPCSRSVGSKGSERLNGVVHPFLDVEAANRYENGPIRKAELGPHLIARPRLEQGCVDAVGDDVTERPLEQ